MKEFKIAIGELLTLTYDIIIVKKSLWSSIPERMYGMFNEESCEFIKDHCNPDICRLLIQKESDNKPDVRLVFTRESPNRNNSNEPIDRRSDQSYRSRLFGGSLISIEDGNIKSLFILDQSLIKNKW